MASTSTADALTPGLAPAAATPSAAGKAPAVRVSQRKTLSCSYCYRRKIKCSKVLPCEACVSRGLAHSCELEPVIVKGSLVAPATAPQRTLTQEELSKENLALQRKIRSQERLIASLQRDLMPKPEPSGSADTSVAPPAGSWAAAIQERENAILTSDLEVLGMPNVPLSPILTSSKEHRPAPAPPAWQPPWLASNPSAVSSFVNLVPPVAQSTFLVEAHLNLLSYVHAVVHGPSYRVEHQRWVESLARGEETELRWDWLALYFSIISSALHSIDEDVALAAGFTAEQIAILPRVWFDLSVDSLNRADYMSAPTITALQAICVLPMIGHTFGASSYLRALLHSGLHSAQVLHFHLLGPETSDMPIAGQVHRELGRRIWSCLVIGEWMSVAYTQTPILVHPRARCALPSNINDSQLSNHTRIKPLPLSTPTLVSHLLGMHRAAEICKSFADAFELAGRVGGKDGVERQYQVVLEHDEQLLSVLDFCPALQPTQEPYPEKVDPSREFDYLPWARYLWATLVPPFRIRWYRHFLGRSFSDERFSGARAICLEAARTLIRECKRPIPAMFSKAWHVKAHSVLAGMVLATEYVHGSSHAPGERHALRLEILEVVDLLRAGVASSGGGSDTILPRGIGLILHLIGEPSAGTSGVESEVTSPSLATLAEISNELPVEHLWPAFDQLEGLDSGWLNPALVGGAEPELWNPDGSFNWEGTMNWDWTAASGLGGSMLG